MHRSMLAGAAFAVALCSSAPGQSYETSPPGLTSIEGLVFADMFGAFRDARCMLFDGELRGAAMTIREAAFRADYSPHTDHNGMGRRWANVTLEIADCRLDRLTNVFSQNATSIPSRVFSGSVAWNVLIGHPPTLPAPFTEAFPFATPWAYGGTTDICLDFDFRGGTLANGAPWVGGAAVRYALDAFPTHDRAEAIPYFHGQAGPNAGCIDSAWAGGAINFLFCTAYGPGYANPKFRDHFRLSTYSYFTAPGQPVGNVVNFAGTAAGIPFPGVACNMLHLDPTRFFMLTITNANGPGAWSGEVFPTGTPDGLIPYRDIYVGVPLWAQALWSDSQTGFMQLSRAVSTTIPWVPPESFRRAIVQPDVARKGGVGQGPYLEAEHNPVVRYGR